MRKSILLFVLFSLMNIPLLLFAQGGYRVTGRILSAEDNQPLIGVSVLEKGTSNGVITDIDGNYSITVTKSPATLQFSYIGMKTIEKQVTASTRLDLKMESDAQQVDEVVVVAYGVRKKGTITGSMAVVKADQLENVPAPSFDQALQGKTPGLQVISSSGEPSASADFQIRGVNSINAGTTPLFILDGIAITADVFSAINPNDIESVSVLKDASSTSIYGARAANGVVVITTKRGRSGTNGNIVARAQYGISKLAYGKWDLMNTTERLNYEEEIGIRKAGTYDRELLERTNIDWRDVVYNDAAPFTSIDLQAGGATQGGFNYYVSGNIHSQDGIALNSDYKRYTLRANLEAKVNKWFKVGTNASFAYEDYSEAVDGDYNTVTPISASRFMLPYWNPYASTGAVASINDGTWLGTNVNPLEYQNSNPSDKNRWKIIASAYGELRPIPGLTIKTLGGVDFLDMRTNMFSMPSYLPNYGEGTVGRAFSRYTNITWSNTATYLFDIKEDHHFNVMVGQEWVDNQSDGFSVVTRGQSNDNLLTMSTAARAESYTDTMNEARYLSFFGRAEYNYLSRYYADISLRRDASSRFGVDSRWANFWSVGGMWNVKGEKFLKNVDWLTNAQLAASIGTSGNSSIPAYEHLALVAGGPIYGIVNDVDMTGIAPYSKGNEKLTWEKTLTTNISLKLGFFDRLNLVAEFYNKQTNDMLMEVPVSAVGGYTSRWSNMGEMVNRGVDLSFDIDVLRLKDFRWNISANASYNMNEITELYDGRDEYDLGSTALYLKVGHSYGEFYLNRYAGVNPANGDALWYDKNGKITNEFKEEDKVLIGKSCNAPWQGGFGTTLSWKGVTVSALFSWVADRYMMNNDRYFSENAAVYSSYNMSRRLLTDRWKKPGDMVTMPRYDVPMQFDDRILEDASFLRLKNLSVSYELPKNLLKPTKIIDRVRVFAQGQNLFTWTKFQGMDPESTANYYQAAYPMSRQFSIGLEVSF